MARKPKLLDEVKRAKRVSDMLVTMHSILAQKFDSRSLYLDCGILLVSTWLCALTFVDPVIEGHLTPFGFSPKVWLGLLGVSTFGLSLIALKVDWKGRKDAHSRARDFYSSIKLRCARLIVAPEPGDKVASNRVLDEFEIGGITMIAVPERDFLLLKQSHKIKVCISRFMDRHPAASIRWVRLRLWFRDNKVAVPGPDNDE